MPKIVSKFCTSLTLCFLLPCISLSGLAGDLKIRNSRGALQQDQYLVGSPHEPACEETPDKYRLWAPPTRLRGANTWQRLKDHRISPVYTCEGDLRGLARLGANYLNLSHPGIFSEKPKHGQYILERDALANLQSLVKCGGEQGMFVVVAYRTGPELNEKRFVKHQDSSKVFTDEKVQSAWVEMWRTTARALKHVPHIVGYDLMVEPDTGGSPERWNSLAKRIINAIREEDRETPIILEGADGGDVNSLLQLKAKEFDPNGDQRLVFSVHQYEPSEYSLQSEGEWEYDCSSLKDKKTPKPSQYVNYSAPRGEILKSKYEDLLRWRQEQKVPLTVNEFGVVRWAGSWSGDGGFGHPVPDADKFIADQLDKLEALGISHAIWKWDPVTCEGDDDFNFMHGQLFSSHSDVPSQLRLNIMRNWQQNNLRPNSFIRDQQQ